MSDISHTPNAGQSADTHGANPLNDSSTNAMSSQRDKTQSSHSTGVGDSGRWSTQRIAIYALFVALAMAVSFLGVPIIPGINWLKFDPAGIVCLVAGFAFGPTAAAVVAVLSFLPHLFGDPWGALIAILVLLVLTVPAALIYKHKRTRSNAALGIVVGAVLAVIAAIVLNLLITPIYANMTTQQVVGLILPALLPFNVVKFIIDGVVTFLIYKPISNYLNR